MSPGLALGGGVAIVSRNTCSTDPDERFPTSLNERHVNSSASSGNSREATVESMIFGPPG